LRSQRLSSRSRVPNQGFRHEDPLALHVESDCNGNYTGVARPTHPLGMAGRAAQSAVASPDARRPCAAMALSTSLESALVLAGLPA
jgi:hypothetical protein